MKYNKEIYSFKKTKEINYSASVTATKREKITIWTSFIILSLIILFSIFILKNIFAMLISIALSICILFTLMIIFIFRPIHKEERKQNEIILHKNDFKK